MSARDAFFFLAGVLAISTLLPLLRSLIRADAAGPASRRTLAFGVAAVVAVLGSALALYEWIGSPQSIHRDASLQTNQTTPPHAVLGQAVASGAPNTPGTMEEATARLAARLAESGGTAADWELLAKAYDFLGRTDDARAARLKETPISPRPIDAAGERDLAQAEKLRRARAYADACRIYARLASRGILSAKAWADYADAAGSRQGGSLVGEPAGFIDAALRLDPKQPKALWLRASLEHEQHREPEALADWRELSRVLPADSPDQRIIAANIEEAKRLGSVLQPEGGALVSTSETLQSAGEAPSRSPAGVRIVGTVELARALASRVPAGATLFIYAKQAGADAPPIAVIRVRADHWPVEFALDDGNAMIPGRTLSGAGPVELEARVSLSGDALPRNGDLVGSAASVDPRARRAVHIAIDHTIG